MEAAFVRVLNMSYGAAWAILAVLAARLALRRAPKRCTFWLWAVPFARLLCPVSLEGAWSLLPGNAAPLTQGAGQEAMPVFRSGLEAVDTVVAPAVARAAETAPQAGGLSLWELLLKGGTTVWLLGAAALLGYSLVRYILLRRQLRLSMPLEGNVYLADGIATPFVLGLFRPRIYLPSGLGEGEREFILLHERTHIRHGDHILKTAAFLALCLHWFNPLVWLAFRYFSRDMEMRCDESVIARWDGDIRPAYAAALLSLATGRQYFTGTPLAFGEGDTGSRIRGVLRYRRPLLGTLVLTALVVALLTACLAVDPAETEAPSPAPTESAAPQTEPPQSYARAETEMAAFLAALPEHDWRVYSGPEVILGNIQGLADYVRTHQLTEEDCSNLLRGDTGLDGAYAEAYSGVFTVAGTRQPYTLARAYFALSEAEQESIWGLLCGIQDGGLPLEDRAAVEAWLERALEAGPEADTPPAQFGSGRLEQEGPAVYVALDGEIHAAFPLNGDLASRIAQGLSDPENARQELFRPDGALYPLSTNLNIIIEDLPGVEAGHVWLLRDPVGRYAFALSAAGQYVVLPEAAELLRLCWAETGWTFPDLSVFSGAELSKIEVVCEEQVLAEITDPAALMDFQILFEHARSSSAPKTFAPTLELRCYAPALGTVSLFVETGHGLLYLPATTFAYMGDYEEDGSAILREALGLPAWPEFPGTPESALAWCRQRTNASVPIPAGAET